MSFSFGANIFPILRDFLEDLMRVLAKYMEHELTRWPEGLDTLDIGRVYR